MKRFLFALALAGLIAPQAAPAADLYGGSTKDGPTYGANFANGTWYLALGAGGSLTDTKLNLKGVPPLGDFNFSGVDADILAGYDYKVASNWLVGTRLGIGIQDVKGAVTLGNVGNQTFNYEIAARTGYVAQNVGLIYLGGGWKWQHIGINLTGWSTDLSGPELFGGLEVDLSGFTGKAGLFAQMEAGYVWFGNWSVPAGGVFPRGTISEDEFTAKARVGFRW